ncbi:hypothetical protein ACO0SA_004644 [Hanseniaspora valbyensis]|uniref:Uncharacterized protein n=1 Tax=Hanseniaspora valbyensis NRRL Y-1626 TaxID=766949 RepID=A0A1B7THH8_9ASCO|nr:hypothetical protein HANVADRAFT_51527 [Hanseniaspora valbyensis NRRL Y-1626]
MKPVVGQGKAWFCTVVSIFGCIILSVLGHLYNSGHEEFVGHSVNDPTFEQGVLIAKTIFTTALVYLCLVLFCGSQIYLHNKKDKVRI